MTTINIPIAAGTDDAFEDSTGAVATGSTSSGQLDAVNEWIGMRFQNVTIPNAATINSATFSCVPWDSGNDEPDITIYCEATDDAAAFAGTSNNISGRSRTSASVNWSNSNLGATGTERYNSASIVSPVQEVINRAGWASGNDLAILITQAGAASRDFRIWFYENGSLIPELDVDYTDPASGGQPTMRRWNTVPHMGGGKAFARIGSW